MSSSFKSASLSIQALIVKAEEVETIEARDEHLRAIVDIIDEIAPARPKRPPPHPMSEAEVGSAVRRVMRHV